MNPMYRLTEVAEIRYERLPPKDVPGNFGAVVAYALWKRGGRMR
jgi:hypothetical protein